MRKFLLALAALFLATPAWGQNTQCPTRPVGDNTNACASTAFVQSALSADPLAHTHILVGNGSNVATDFGSLVTLGDTGAMTLTPSAAVDALTINPLAASNARGFVITQSGANSSIAGPKSYNDITVTNVTGISTTTFSNGLPNNRLDGLHVTYLAGIAASATYQSAVHAETRMISAGSNSTMFGTWSSIYVNVANSNLNAAHGGGDSYAIVDSGGSVGLLEGHVFEAGIWGTGTAAYRAAIVLDNIGAKQAATLDAAIIVTNYSGWAGIATDAGAYNALVAFSKAGGAMGTGLPLATTANLFLSDTAMTITDIFHFSNVTVSGNYATFPNAIWQGSTGFLTLGSTNTPDTPLTINNNNGATVATTFSTAIHLVGADGNPATQTFDSYASLGLTLARASDGTRASKSAKGANTNMYQFATQSWDGSAYASNAIISLKTVNAQSGTDHSSIITFQTVPTASTALAEAGRFNPSGGFTVGDTTDPGIGVIRALNGFISGTAAKTLVLKQGANGAVGTFVCNGVTPVTVNNTAVAITDAIIISLNAVGGTVGAAPDLKTITGATGFTVACTAADTSTYNYAIIKNAA